MKWNVFGEFDEAGNPKTLLVKNSVKLIDFAEPQKNVIEAVRQTLHFAVIRSLGRLYCCAILLYSRLWFKGILSFNHILWYIYSGESAQSKWVFQLISLIFCLDVFQTFYLSYFKEMKWFFYSKDINNKGGSRSTAQQHGGERTFLQKEAMYLLYTPLVILPYF